MVQAVSPNLTDLGRSNRHGGYKILPAPLVWRRAGKGDVGKTVQDDTRGQSEWYTSKELSEILGYAPAQWSEETLTHNTNNAVTAGIWRIRAGSLSAVLKVVSPPGVRAASEEWNSSEDPSHWNYWEREVLAYERGVTSVYSAAGIAGPRLLALNRRPNGEVSLWLEDALSEDGSVAGMRWGMESYRRFAHALGLAQGRIAAGSALDHPWLTRRFLRDYVLSKHVDRSILYSDEAWRRPLVRDNFPDGLRRELIRLHEEREWFFTLMERLPRTVCHLDVWPNNLFARRDGTFTLVDWSFVGEGALGEDVGNLVPDSVFDLFVPARDLADLDGEVFGGYLSGLREAGWDGDERMVRLGMCASAVKYEWLGPLMLQRASNASQPGYGGRESADAERLYAERGIALAFLASWAEEARALVEELGTSF
jgi:Phosphotransferase enzyme family